MDKLFQMLAPAGKFFIDFSNHNLYFSNFHAASCPLRESKTENILFKTASYSVSVKSSDI